MKRVLTAALLVPPVLAAIYLGGPVWFAALLVILGMLCFHEFARLAAAHGFPVMRPVGYAAGILMAAAPFFDPALIAVAVAASLALALRYEEFALVVPRTAVLWLGVLYCFLPWYCAWQLRQRSPHWLVLVLGVNWVGDAAAFLAGSLIGKHRMAPRLSPGKTWEGAAASVVCSVVFGVVFLAAVMPEFSRVQAVLISVVANGAGQLGDLAESAMKRGAGVKESGGMLPGHGGWLDRVDASLFSLPVVEAYLRRAPGL